MSGYRVGTGRARAAAAVACVVLGLTACTGDAGSQGAPEPSPEGSGASPAPGGGEPDGGGSEEAVVGPASLPEGRLQVEETLRSRPGTAARTARGPWNYSHALTDDAVLVATGSGELLALDHDGELVWRTRQPAGRGRAEGGCDLVPPPPDATAVTVFSGVGCTRIDTYSLEDGSLLDSSTVGDVVIDELGAPSSIGPPVRAGEHTYWTDLSDVYRVGEDGSQEVVFDPEDLGLVGDDGTYFVAELAGLVGSDVLVAEIETTGRGGLGRERTVFVGLEVADDGRLDEVWRTDPREALPRGRGPYVFVHWLDGAVADVLRGGPTRARISRFDADSGELRELLVVRTRDLQGRPSWLSEFGEDGVRFEADGSMVSSGGTQGTFGGSPDVGRYDLETGEVSWVADALRPSRRESDPDSTPLGLSDDGEHYYVHSEGITDEVLFELDAATGRTERKLVFPGAVEGRLLGPEMVVVGETVIAYSGDQAGVGDDAEVVTMRVG